MREVTTLLFKLIEDAGCKISGFGDDTTITFAKDKPAPVRELWLLVAVNTCCPETADLALGLANAMASNHQEEFIKSPEWDSDEGREAARSSRPRYCLLSPPQSPAYPQSTKRRMWHPSFFWSRLKKPDARYPVSATK